MRVQLQINSTTARKLYLREGYVYQIGRTEAADIAIPDDGHMSGLHFSLEVRGGTCLLRDLHSSNGTKVNGEPTTEKRLRDGDTISAGKTRFVVHIDGAPEVPNLTDTRMLVSEPPPAEPAKRKATSAQSPRTIAMPREEALGSRPGARPSPATATFPDYERGWQDPDATVRREAMLAAVWTRQSWVMDRLRAIARVAAADNPDALWLLGVLGDPGDLSQILSTGRDRSLGPQRFTMLGAYGHPETIDFLLGSLNDPDPEVASAAGAAFLKITGFKLSTGRVELPPAQGADDFEREFAEQVEIVDPQQVAERWPKESARFADGLRWCRGHNVTEGAGSALSVLDLSSRAEAILRDHFREIAPADPRELVKFVRPHRV